jgi:hypothetical protein
MASLAGGTMSIQIPLDRMTVAEKWEALNVIWADLTKSTASIPIPDWHVAVLKERHQRFEDAFDKLRRQGS